MPVGRQMQFFGARVNLAKTLLYAINGGRDEITGEQVGPAHPPVTGDRLSYDEVAAALDRMMDWVAETYVDALNVIHYMHGKYAYERIEMALHDYPVKRTLACGIAGLSVAADSLSEVPTAVPAAAGPAAGTAGPVTGSVHSWDISTGVDGPGTRFVVFASGCPLRCLYCHNPGTWRMHDGTRTTVDALVARAERYRRFIRIAGGGEPLMQPAFTGELLRRCRETGLHTALDTSGHLGHRASDALLADTDLVLLDVKSWDPAAYRKVTTRDPDPTVRFARRLAELGRPAWVRFVLVPGLTDAEENVDGLAAFAATLPNVEHVDVLPYHRMAEAKYAGLGLPYPLPGTEPPSAELLERVHAQFRAHGVRSR
ncbi:hypothetical protein GCM10010466_02110 [Planomonospora alba]|uniref:Pyruvate formate-lyase-activating enzyme n=2 Tax=Planomonospora alba TaxID=161354 RepID=A0ABP6MMX1_9ACTN